MYSGHMDRFHALCSNEQIGQDKACSAPMNGGVPCKEEIEENIPRRSWWASPYRCDCEYEVFKINSSILDKSLLQFSSCSEDVELGLGVLESSVTNPKILIARCNGDNCLDINVKVTAKAGSLKIMWREYKIKEEDGSFIMAPITVSLFCFKLCFQFSFIVRLI